jgi:5-methyltetrahydropteroyltriglutamate--homocysteine methyltransferase
MKRSTERILTTHAGSLPRPEDLRDVLVAKDEGRPYDQATFATRLRSAVGAVVQQQIMSGLDIINDGELSKRSFSTYARERLSGYEQPQPTPDEPPSMISGRDMPEFADYFASRGGFGGVSANARQVFCTGPLTYIGHAAVRADIEHFKAALAGVQVAEAFLPAIAPGTIEHWMRNRYYPSDEAYLYAIAEAMREEYQAIVAAGFLLQIDDPDLPDAWQIHSHMTVPEYRQFAELRIEALNHALRGIPPERVRLHVCWGSYHGPHKYDIPLKDIADLILKVNVGGYSIEASNPRHEHEWRVWEDVKLPEGKVLIPGVVGHATDFIEHPELVAERLVKYARLVGRENVIAGTDCGLGGRVGHPKIVWAKFQAMAEGARLATQQLWVG